MHLFGRDLDVQVAIIAEIGNNHEGDPSIAERLIEEAAIAGVDAVKFQTFRPAHYVRSSDRERFARLQKFDLDRSVYRRLKDVARSAGVAMFSTPFDLGSLAFVDQQFDVIKIASGDNTFYPLIEAAAETGKPLILSTGIAKIPEIERAKGLIETVWAQSGSSPGLVLLHCVSSYPVQPEDANLGAIGALKDRFGGYVGYSDHTLGIDAAVLAVACGARVIEKHFTLAHDYSDFRDHQLSADPGQLTELCKRVREADVLLGIGEKLPSTNEQAGASGNRRSIVAARDLTAGTVLRNSDITWVRPGGGIPPGQERLILGRVLRLAIEGGSPINQVDLEE